ncbi:MAG: hypothetical protein JWM18_578 [Chloroflexi bacterium]|nr:hypothetical protein [Chloroflexota bacterium]
MSDLGGCAPDRHAVFVGPGLHGVDIPASLLPALRPPIRDGDLAALPGSDRGGWTIAIIDGEFGQSLAVTVSEIRQTLAAGNRVIGGSSMGALRAVECAPLGMVGVGWVYERYRDGDLFSDAEVALTYDPDTFRPLTVPFVNLRWLASAHLPGLPMARWMEEARRIHFRRRDLGTLRAMAVDVLPATFSARLCSWLRPERLPCWDRKQHDALAVVAALTSLPTVALRCRAAPKDIPPAVLGAAAPSTGPPL